MLFRRKHTRLPQLPDQDPVDHSLADEAIFNAAQAYQAAQEQATQARQVVAELQRVNLRNGFAPAIRDSFDRRYGGAL